MKCQHSGSMKKRHYLMLGLSLLILVAAGSENDFVADIQKKLKSYYSENILVKVHLFFNQPQYHVGDTAFFKVTFVTAGQNNFIGGRQLLNLMLVDSAGTTVFEQKVVVKDGLGYSNFIVPETPSGIYTLVAFNSWMRNQKAQHYFRLPFTIAGKKIFRIKESDKISIYPEGGALIRGIPSKVVVKGPRYFAGFIVDAEGNTVTRVTTDSMGLASFQITPVSKKYFFRTDEGTDIAETSDVGEGVALSLLENDSAGYRIAVGASSMFPEKRLNFVLWNRDEVAFAAIIPIISRKDHTVHIPFARIKPGTNGITIFTDDGEVVAERYFYQVRSATSPVSIALDKRNYNVRDKVTVRFALNADVAAARISATVYQKDIFAGAERNSLGAYLDLLSEFPDLPAGIVRRSESYINDHLIAAAWSRFSWQDVIAEKRSVENKFQHDLHVSGTAFYTETNTPLPGATRLFFLLQNDLTAYETITDENGRFDFRLLNNIAGVENLIFRADLPPGSAPVTIKLDKENFVGLKYSETTADDAYEKFSSERNYLGNAFYHLDANASTAVALEINTIEDELAGADVEVLLDEYLIFPTMQEMILEVLPYVKFRKQKGKDAVRIYIRDLKKDGDEDPLYFIDGVLTDDTRYFLSIKPEHVYSVKMINTWDKLKRFGILGKNGIIIIDTKIPGHSQKIPRSVNTITVNGVAHPIPFKSELLPPSEHVPVFHSTLHWEPEIEVSANKEVVMTFYSADNTGTFTVVIDGITSDGTPVSAQKDFQVTFSKSQ